MMEGRETSIPISTVTEPGSFTHLPIYIVIGLFIFLLTLIVPSH